MLMQIEIEKRIPIPPKKVVGAPAKYPWGVLKIGDSFFVRDKQIRTIGPLASNTGRKLKKKFVCRTHNGGVRVWRIK